MNVNFEVTDTKRAGNCSMIVFAPDGKGIMASTPGFDIVYDRGACVLDVDVNDGVYVNNERQELESDSESVFP